MTRTQRNVPAQNPEFTDTVIWEEVSNELSAYVTQDADTDQTVEISTLLTDEEADSLLSQGKHKPVVK